MLITIVSSENSWFNEYLEAFVDKLKDNEYQVSWVHQTYDIKNGDVAFFLSFEQIVDKSILRLHKNNIVIHESNLPKGKGMSPITWQILEGKSEIPITLFEMVEKVDAGDIYLQNIIKFDGVELVNEIRDKQAKSTLKICMEFLKNYPEILKQGQKQIGEESFYKRRSVKDSQLDINKTIAEQFDLLRVVDNEKYPAFFEYKSQKYFLKISKE